MENKKHFINKHAGKINILNGSIFEDMKSDINDQLRLETIRKKSSKFWGIIRTKIMNSMLLFLEQQFNGSISF